MKPPFSLTFSILLLSGCVSVQRFDEKQAELSACQAKQAELTSALKQATDARDACQSKYSQAVTTSKQMLEHADALRFSLQDEIRNKQVEIETLKDKLTVRVLDRILFKTGSAQIPGDDTGLHSG